MICRRRETIKYNLNAARPSRNLSFLSHSLFLFLSVRTVIYTLRVPGPRDS